MGKKVLFVSPHMIIGGVEKALLAMLEACHAHGYAVDAAFVRNRGGFSEQLPDYVNIIEIPVSDDEADILLGGGARAAIRSFVKKVQPLKAMRVVFRKKFKKSEVAEYLGDFRKIPALQKHYDLAICYHMHMPFLLKYVVDKTIADKKIAWIHNDFKVSGFPVNNYKELLDKYDGFFCVSEQLKSEFTEICPQYADKAQVFHNPISKDLIVSKSKEYYPEEYNNKLIKVLSVGRLNEQKGFDIAIEVASMLKAEGESFVWYIIGDGELYDKLSESIEANGLSEEVKLLGAKQNPYPYMANCDIYVQPSRHEGYCLTLCEAKVLKKPIVTTNFAGAREQLTDNITGIICDTTKESIFLAVKQLFNNKSKREALIEALNKASFPSSDFYKLTQILGE